jgi:hypothetical protein
MQEASVMNAFKLFRKGPTNQIAAAVTYDAATDTATLNPTNNLKRGVIYKAVVSTLAKDVEGNRLDQDDSPLEREPPALASSVVYAEDQGISQAPLLRLLL